MTSEWDDTPWAGSPVKAVVPYRPPVLSVKAVTGAGVTAYATDYPLTSIRQEPQEKAAAFLKAYKCGWFYKAESKISGDLATLPWTVTDGDIESEDRSETEVGRPDLDIPFERLNPIEQFMRLMEKPNPYQTGRQLRQKTFIRRDMAGWTFWYLEAAGERAPVTAIYGISPTRLWPAYAKDGTLLGYALDKNSPSGATMTFEPWEIVAFSNATAEDEDVYGVGVVEAVYAELPLTDLMTRHTADLLLTGGRLAGMMWPKERTLDEDEFTDVQRAWRNVVSDPASAKRLLVFPEPMEWSAGASTPAEIGIPELAALNRENILTAFPIDPTMLGVPMPSGLNASGETRRELQRAYWEGTIGPRAASFDEIVQTNIVSRYEAIMGQTFRFESELPQLDDASSLLEKAGAFRSLIAIGFEPTDTIKAVGLDHIKWTGLPAKLDPNAPEPEPVAPAQDIPGTSATVTDDTAGQSSVTQVVAKATKAREAVVDANDPRIARFLEQQRDRTIDNIRATRPKAKAAQGEWVKADPGWWDSSLEDRLLREALSTLYVQAARGSLQVVADLVDGIIPNRAVGRIADDLMKQGGERIVGINAHTRDTVAADLAEGTRRGYSLNQLIDGVPEEQFNGIRALPVFDEARAEVIARTETMLSYNRAALDAYGEFGVSEVLAYDGDDDAECAERNGQTFTVEEALAIEDHPNGTLDWAPVITDKAWHPQPSSVKVDVGSPVINLHMPETVVNVPEQHYPEPVAPIVNVTTPETIVNVAASEAPAPVIHVEAPKVNVPAPQVTVNPPIVNVKAQPSDVNVTVTPDLRITGMPDRVTERKVERDKDGRITRTVDVETDVGG